MKNINYPIATLGSVDETLNFCRLSNFACFFTDCLVFFKINFYEKNSFRNTIRMPNSLDQDQARQNVGPDLSPNCLQRLSAVDTLRLRVNKINL